MKVAGVIAEFNPMHDGHRYLLQTIQKTIHPDVLVVVLSTWFSSRGLPSLESPQTKTRLALEAGADLVIALPSVYTMQSADYFALYAIEALKTAGVNLLCFGSELADKETLNRLAEEVSRLQKDPSTSLARNAARQGLDMRPNDILALQYIRCCRMFGMDYQPILRDQSLKSATAIRHDFFAGSRQKEDSLFEASQSWPSYYPYLRYMLLESNPAILRTFFLVEEGIENRMAASARINREWDGFLKDSVSKTYSKARIQRTAMMILMQISKKDMKEHESFFDIQLLGMNRTGRDYLSSLPKGTPVYSRFKDLPDWLKLLELKASRLYNLVSEQETGWKVVFHAENNRTHS